MKPNYETYSRIQKAVDYINSGLVNTLEEGRHEIADGVYVNVSSYLTKEKNIYEAHRKYIDIHYIIEGEERLEVANVMDMEVTEEYVEEKDYLLGRAKGESHIIKKGQYLVTMPEEAHSPSLCVDKPIMIKKAVFKILL